MPELALPEAFTSVSWLSAESIHHDGPDGHEEKYGVIDDQVQDAGDQYQ